VSLVNSALAREVVGTAGEGAGYGPGYRGAGGQVHRWSLERFRLARVEEGSTAGTQISASSGREVLPLDR
jgi:hypothetical protein